MDATKTTIPQFPEVFEETKLCDLLGERSTILFNRLQFTVENIQFLRYSCTKWPQYESYLRLERTVSSLKVVNDAAERGIRLLEEYKDILTKDFGQRNLIMQCVEESRKICPTSRNQPSQHHQLLAFEFAIYPFFYCYRFLVNKKNFIQAFVQQTFLPS